MSTTRQQAIVFFIDTTSSMSVFIDALRSVLREFMSTIALTGIFDKVGILAYRDYDMTPVVNWSYWLTFADQALYSIARDIKATGGGDTPEAVRTAIYTLLNNMPDNTDLLMIHLADAPEHPEDTSKLQQNGLKEHKALGDLFPNKKILHNMERKLQETNSTISYNSITSRFESILNLQLNKQFPGQQLEIYPNAESIKEAFYKIFNNIVDGESRYVKPELAIRLNTAVNRIRTDETYATYTYQCLKNCFNISIMAMCNLDVIGKIWREFSKRRGDQRRGELFKQLENSKKFLSEANRKRFEEFNRNSYSYVAEIEEDITDFALNNGIHGLIKYVPDTYMHPHDIISFCRACSVEDQHQIKEILVRVEITEFTKSPATLDDLPKNCLPANMPAGTQLKYILHLVAPGTCISGRPLMLLALLAINTPLDKSAREILTHNKGKWLDFSYFEEEGPMKGTPKVPENFSLSFLRLLKNHTEFLTDEENAQLSRLLRISYILNLPNIDLEIEERDYGCLDGSYPSYLQKCTKCETMQPMSLITRELICAYCHHNTPTVIYKEDSVCNVQCTKCYAMYARNPTITVPGRALCCACRGLNPDVKSLPTVKCTSCDVNFITYQGLPDNKCLNCTIAEPKKQRYVTRRMKAKELFSKNDFIKFYNSAGLYSDKFDTGFLKLHESVTLGECITTTIEQSPNDPIINRAALYAKMCEYARGTAYNKPECDLCCNYTYNIGDACGRKGCTQRLCNSCGTNWYGVLKPGTMIQERHLVCPFCTRKPDARAIRRWCPEIIWFNAQTNLDPANYHAWCVECNKAKILGVRACGAAPALAENWRCDDCTNLKYQKDSIYKACPSCEVLVERTHGCNHITCQCGAHWCFECGLQCESATATYEHMRSTHGRIYANEEPYYNDE